MGVQSNMMNVSKERIKEMTQKVTTKLLGIDSIAGCTYENQHKICQRFVEQICDSLGIVRGEVYNDIITEEVHYTIDHYDDYLYEL